MSKLIRNKLKMSAAALGFAVIIMGCSSDDNVTPIISSYFAGIEAATDPATDVLALASSLEAGTITPVNNGFEQAAWTTFMQGPDQIIVGQYSTAPEFTSYELVDGVLTKGESFFTQESVYAFDFVDESSAILVTSPRSGFADKTIHLIDTDNMEIAATVNSNFGDLTADSLLAFPTDAKVRGNKLFISYYHIHARGDFSTPSSDMARVAVFSYPELAFEKLIEDNRAPNIGRYYSSNGLEIAENGDIYAYASSSLACGYAPAPSKNSAILRIANGASEFDADFYIDFETLSGGYKINDLYYVGNGKAVVRVLQEDETNADFLWATYSPVGTTPLLSNGFVDLNAGTYTPISGVPMGGGGWNAAYRVENGKLYLGVSNSSEASIYVFDPEAGTAVKGASIDGNYCKGILALPQE